MAQFLDESIQKQLKEVFLEIKNPVQILFFGSSNKDQCEYCAETLELMEEVTGLSEQLSLEAFDVEKQPEAASKYSIERVPGIVIAAKDGDEIIDYGVRISGIPAGQEFNVLVNDILVVSNRDSGLSDITRKALKGLSQPVHLLVFTTPT